MASYTIIKSDGTVLTTIPEGSINTTASTLALPGKNFSGYGLYVDTDLVRMTEHFAATTVPANPIRGQLWYDLGNAVMKYCPTNGESNGANWVSIAGQGGTAIFTAVTVSGNITAGNATLSGSLTANAITAAYANLGNLKVTGTSEFDGNALFNANVSIIGNLNMNGSDINNVDVITANLANIKGANLNGGNIGNANVITANLFTGTFSAPGANTQVLFNDAGNIGADSGFTYNKTTDSVTVGNLTVQTGGTLTANTLTTGAAATAGTVTGTWTLTAGSTLQATYADLAERHHADADYPLGTIVRVGGENEITQVTSKHDLPHVLGVVSKNYAYLMNAEAGPDSTHPAIACLGRVPVRIVGPVVKGDKITVGVNGCGLVSMTGLGFGWALESNSDAGEKLVLCVIK